MNKDDMSKKRLAACAVFRELYDSKKDIFGIIAEFLKSVIIENGKHTFDSTEITQFLRTTYGFDIPEAVINTSLKKRLKSFVKKVRGGYTADLANVNNDDLREKTNSIETEHGYLFDAFFSYMESERGKLTEAVKSKIVYSFCDYILGESVEHEYSDDISAFLIKNRNDENFINRIKIIKEGIILYSGLTYNNNPEQVGSWRTELTIVLDMEILFHLAGYNGELFKNLFDDFHMLVKEINNANKRKLIDLVYFEETDYEVEKYFYAAENIVTGKKAIHHPTSAMGYIVDGCKTGSDIITKKSQFYRLLQENGITKYNNPEYFANKNHKYNLIDNDKIRELSNSLSVDQDELIYPTKLLNRIHILRKNKSENNFVNIGVILLTGKSIVLKCSRNDELKPKKTVPLATDLDFITNKFWFKLNKGFSNNNIPKSFDIITKAQIALSRHLNNSVTKQYEKLEKELQEGKMTREDVTGVTAVLRQKERKPEDINEENVGEVVDCITIDDIENYHREKSLLKNKVNEQDEENRKLRSQKKENLKEMEKVKEESAKKDRELEEYKEKEHQREERERKEEEQKQERKNRRKKILLTTALCITICGTIGFFIFSESTIIGRIISGVFSIVGLLGSVITIIQFTKTSRSNHP